MRTYTFELAWHSPYTSPPNGQPRVLLSITREVESSANLPAEIRALADPGNGYAIHIHVTPKPARRISQEGRASVRRKSLARRIERKWPLFATQVTEEELAARPDYFDGADYQGVATA